MATEEKRKQEVLGVLLITLGIFILLSLVSYDYKEVPQGLKVGHVNNYMGTAGIYISYYLIKYTIGIASLLFPILIILWGWNQLNVKKISGLLKKTIFSLIFALYISIILGLPQAFAPTKFPLGHELSGKVGQVLALNSLQYFGAAGCIIVLLTLIMVTLILATGMSVSNIVTNISTFFAGLYRIFKRRFSKWEQYQKIQQKVASKAGGPQGRSEWLEGSPAKLERPRPEPSPLEFPHPREFPPELSLAEEPGEEILDKEFQPEPLKGGKYVFPSTKLLKEPPEQDEDLTWEELMTSARTLEEKLADFGIQGRVVEVNPGPVITRFEVEPAPGVKVSRFTSLADDLALVMRAKRIRVVAPIPGKAAIGIEIPNHNPQTVYLKEIIDSPRFRDSESVLTMALGKTIDGEVYTADLRTMPHLLIAGATGSGKSVCLHAIITSILFKAHPSQVQLLLIDPKRLELTPYAGLKYHHVTYREDLDEEVITNANNAISVLRSITIEMEKRYELLARAGVRNIDEYNAKFQSGQLKALEGEEPFRKLEYLVVIVDELADLMLVAAKEVEEPIARLTQMSRAVGIHLILATQRPSVDVITGVIKANFPARIAFQVASKTDSRTVLDMNGAEKLLGRGDMLFLSPGSPEPVRIHGAYVSVEEVENIINHIRQQPRFPKLKLPLELEDKEAVEGLDLGFQPDKLFNEAAKLVVRHQQGSVSLLQRRLKVGYARAARLIDELEAAGIVGPFDGSKAREVLVTEEDLEDMGIT
ncbi:MAG: DNA translocase FtsK 4TM domain-containing protein [candidate division KSB1 bacterium]|nr:DNA translocase FtsK 4TM domain-containing protein [candidate division KSB1 bacterium]